MAQSEEVIPPATSPPSTAEPAKSELGGPDHLTRGLYFAPQENGVTFSGTQISYKLDSDKNRVNFSGIIFGANQLYIQFDQLKRADVPQRFWSSGQLKKKVTSENLYVIAFNWPKALPSLPRIEILGDRDEVLLSQEISEKLIEDWQSHIKEAGPARFAKNLESTRWGLIDIDLNDFSFLSPNREFKFCVSSYSEDFSVQSCTNKYHVEKIEDYLHLSEASFNLPARISVNGKEYGDSVILTLPIEQNLSFDVQFKNGVELKFNTGAVSVEILDVAWGKGKSTIIVTGRGKKPIGSTTEIVIPRQGFWGSSVLEEKSIWRFETPKEAPIMKFGGIGGIPFSFLISFKELPAEDDRAFISDRRGNGTYLRKPRFELFSANSKNISSSEAALVSGTNGIWLVETDAPNKGVDNPIHFKLEKENSSWLANDSLYRSPPYEIVGKLSPLFSNDSQVAFGAEVSASAWAEDLFGWENYYLSKKRWGLNLEYESYFPSLQTGTATLIPFQTLLTDVRFNLNPGVKFSDEVFGLALGSYFLNIGAYNLTFVGIGAYWSRSLPKGIDGLISHWSWLKHPKFIDVDFNYYVLSLDPRQSPGITFDLGIQLKSFLSSFWFWNLGFNLKAYGFTDNYNPSVQSNIQFQRSSVNFGIGCIF